MRFNRAHIPYASHLIKFLSVVGLAVVLTNCVETFDLPVKKEEVGFLVVDGFLNTANGAVNVKLMRATLINEKQMPFEGDAQASLEDAEGNLYPLIEKDSGRYEGIAPSLEIGKQYRLYIKTLSGKEYRSKFVAIKYTPVIDSIGWRADPDGTQIILDTHDPTNQTRYYRWTFEETWEYHSWYISWWIFSDTTPVRDRNVDEMVNVCFKTEYSNQIFTTSTVALAQDIVNDYEIQFLPRGTEKLSHHYSILVKQYAISKETYEYLEKLKKTSQDLNGLYAPQPSSVTGNVVNVSDPSEVVLGYFDAGQVIEKRIHIAHAELPDHLRVYDWWVLCYKDYIDTANFNLNPRTHIVIDQVPDETGMPIGWTYSTLECGDCRVRGGVTRKPPFMPRPDFYIGSERMKTDYRP